MKILRLNKFKSRGAAMYDPIMGNGDSLNHHLLGAYGGNDVAFYVIADMGWVFGSIEFVIWESLVTRCV